jgi:hypothetical protein
MSSTVQPPPSTSAAPAETVEAVEPTLDQPIVEPAVAIQTEPAVPAEGVAPAATNVPMMSPNACALELKQRFPALFAGAVKPLKLRVQVDIQQRAPGVFTKQALSAFFRRHTGSTSYLIAVSKAPQRIDLDGQPAGEIAPEHRQAALDELARRRANNDSRRELEEQQRRNRAGLLHDYQTTTLTAANFCALKGVAVDELEGLLAIARSEAEERARQQPPAFERPHRPGPPAGRRDQRGDAGGAGRPNNGRPAARPPR